MRITDKEVNYVFNEKHKNYAPELRIAVEAWIELYWNEKKSKNKKGVRSLLEEWLKENNIKLGECAIRRISTLICSEKRKKKATNCGKKNPHLL